jgi:hypothetical protein
LVQKSPVISTKSRSRPIWFKNRRLFQPNPEAAPFGSKIAGYFNQIQGQARLVQKSPVISTKSKDLLFL